MVVIETPSATWFVDSPVQFTSAPSNSNFIEVKLINKEGEHWMGTIIKNADAEGKWKYVCMGKDGKELFPPQKNIAQAKRLYREKFNVPVQEQKTEQLKKIRSNKKRNSKDLSL